MQHAIRLALAMALLAACEPLPPYSPANVPPPPAPPPATATIPEPPPIDQTGLPPAPTEGFEVDGGLPGVPVAVADGADCGASARQAYVGRPASEAAEIPAAGQKRVLGVDEIAGGAPDPTRMTVQLGTRAEGEIISRIYCG